MRMPCLLPYRPLINLGAVLFIAQSISVTAAPLRIDCPATVARTSLQFTAPKGWAGTVPDDLVLAAGSMMSGLLALIEI